MRIPLDYYRILSVPVKATPEQLEQAYSDRLQQQPRREYSESAILARQELIQHSYQVLSDSGQRAVYDAQFLANMQLWSTSEPQDTLAETTDSETVEVVEVVEDVPAPVSANPTIEIPSNQLIGGLLILHELAEYELVLKIGIDYFNHQNFQLRSPEDELSIDTTKEDLILSLVLAYLELGREQWHRREYENAAVSGQMGIDLLLGENLFPHLKAELELDLYKLRPYRVLELISQHSAQSPERAKGFKLLREMLLQRVGIKGKDSDRFGLLSFDQFLCFVQELRTYLTSVEQQQLFDREEQSDSAIANYLAVYALLGRGFSLRQPELILRAQRKLDSLSERQDVGWEQTITALLLGHIEKAIYHLKNTQDTSKLEQVQQHCLGSSDLLPGLCFYGEKWLQEDVLAQFTDLAATQLTLKEYFSDRQVQEFLEELAPPTTFARATSTASEQPESTVASSHRSKTAKKGIISLWRNLFSTAKPASAKARSANKAVPERRELVGAAVTNGSIATATIERNDHLVAPARKSPDYTAVGSTHHTASKNHRAKKSPSLPLQSQAQTRAVPPAVMQKAEATAKRRVAPPKKRSPATLWQGWLLMMGLVVGVGTLGFIATKLLLSPSVKTANQAQLTIAVDQPAIELPPKQTKPVTAQPKLTFAEQSQQVIQNWLSSKSAAFGKEYQIDQLNNILAEPLLSTWRDRATAYQAGNFYREYEHNLTMRSATVNPSDRNKATVEAEVQEIAKHYQSGKLDNAKSYDDNLLVRYQLVRQGEKWLIQQAEVLKTL
ncbi:MAG: IMS domain-containing protein [Pleurocapsa sp.]